MITDKPISNIFVPRNDWTVKSINCKVFIYTTEYIIRKEVRSVFLHDPFCFTKSGKAEAVRARQVFFYFLSIFDKDIQRSMAGKLGKEHSTFIYSIKTVNNDYDTDKVFRAKIDKIEAEIRKRLNV